MKHIRRSNERGFFDHGWLKSYHTFSFAEYRDPKHVHFRHLRVMNEDWVAPGQGFGEHPHRDMEIVTYVLQGQLEHRDSMGNGEVLRPGEFQRMSAGSGITHSEFNPSASEPTHLYQIWLFPAEKGIEPSYEQRPFDKSGRQGRWQLVAAPIPSLSPGTEPTPLSRPDQTSEAGPTSSKPLAINQDARIYLGDVEPGHALIRELDPKRFAWLQVLRGNVVIDKLVLAAGDGLAISEESSLNIGSLNGAELMLFDLA